MATAAPPAATSGNGSGSAAAGYPSIYLFSCIGWHVALLPCVVVVCAWQSCSDRSCRLRCMQRETDEGGASPNPGFQFPTTKSHGWHNKALHLLHMPIRAESLDRKELQGNRSIYMSMCDHFLMLSAAKNLEKCSWAGVARQDSAGCH
jgi:hypothetical protein